MTGPGPGPGPGPDHDTGPVHAVLPGGVDDPATPSGGNTYDRRLCAALEDAGRTVRRIEVAGAWPWPSAADRERLDGALAAVPAGGVVLLDGLVGCAAPDVLARHADRLRLAVLVHLPLADETGLDPADAAVLDQRERQALHAAAAVLATGDAVARRLVEHHGLPAGRVSVAPPGVDPAPATRATDAGTRLLCVASITPRKGHDVLVEALATLAGAVPAGLPWRCVCAGPEPRTGPAAGHARQVRERVAALGLADRVTFPGPLDAASIAACYADADLLVLPSRAEPFGMVVTEALARGVPVLASAVDGIPQALGRAPGGRLPGVLVPPGDPRALAAALRGWLTRPSLRLRLRAAAASRRTGLDGWARTASQVATVLGGPAPVAAGHPW